MKKRWQFQKLMITFLISPHPDLSAKGKSTLDQLEETRFEMRQMQSNFAEQESQWREKSSCLEVELINKDQRLEQIFMKH